MPRGSVLSCLGRDEQHMLALLWTRARVVWMAVCANRIPTHTLVACYGSACCVCACCVCACCVCACVCARSIVKREGVLGLWKGSGPNLGRATTLAAVELSSYDEVCLLVGVGVFAHLYSSAFLMHVSAAV